MPVFDVDQLKSIGKCIFQAVGSVPKEAEIVARLLEAISKLNTI